MSNLIWPKQNSSWITTLGSNFLILLESPPQCRYPLSYLSWNPRRAWFFLFPHLQIQAIHKSMQVFTSKRHSNSKHIYPCLPLSRSLQQSTHSLSTSTLVTLTSILLTATKIKLEKPKSDLIMPKFKTLWWLPPLLKYKPIFLPWLASL